MKPRYIVEVTTIDLIPCKTKKEMIMCSLKHEGENLAVYTPKEFKEIYGEEYK